jgi:hypothetical protein
MRKASRTEPNGTLRCSIGGVNDFLGDRLVDPIRRDHVRRQLIVWSGLAVPKTDYFHARHRRHFHPDIPRYFEGLGGVLLSTGGEHIYLDWFSPRIVVNWIARGG